MNTPATCYETTPYGVEKIGDKYVVKQTWWDKIMSGEFDTREEAQAACVEIARSAGSLRRVRL